MGRAYPMNRISVFPTLILSSDLMTYALHQLVRVSAPFYRNGIHLKQGTEGRVTGITEFMQPPLIWVMFPLVGEIAMKEEEIEAVEE